jgi:hypothetical protein
VVNFPSIVDSGILLEEDDAELDDDDVDVISVMMECLWYSTERYTLC